MSGPKKFPLLLFSPEVSGMGCGLLSLIFLPSLATESWNSTAILGVLASLAVLAGMIVSGITDPQLHRSLRTKAGSWAGMVAVLTASACTILTFNFRHLSGAEPVVLLSLMPAGLAGIVAAGFGSLMRQMPASTELLLQAPSSSKPNRLLLGTIRLLIVSLPVLASMVPPPTVKAPYPVQVLQVPPEPVAVRQNPSRVPFSYARPEALLTASPLRWSLRTQRRLGQMNPGQPMVFSTDEEWLAGVDQAGSLVIYELDSERTWRFSSIPQPVLQMAFHPDRQKMFVVMRSDPIRIGILDIVSGSFTNLPQPKKYAVPQGRVAWNENGTVLFFPEKGATLALNLDTLELDPLTPEAGLRDRMEKQWPRSLPKNDRWAFEKGVIPRFAELPEVEGTSQWEWRTSPTLVLSNKTRASRRIFSEVRYDEGDPMFGTGDGSKILHLRQGDLVVYYFETGPVPPLRWRITLPHGPEKVRESTLVQTALNQGTLSLLMYAPLINPLNQKTVGPDREAPKAVLRVLEWKETQAEVWIESGAIPYSAGDVFADLHIPGNPPQLIQLAQPQRWWTPVPVPAPTANDESALPLRADFLAKVQSQATPAAGVAAEEDDLQKEISNLVWAHHAAAAQGRLQDLANGYGPMVDYLTKGMRSREFILDDEHDYRRNYQVLSESVTGKINIERIEPGRLRVGYLMDYAWRKFADNSTGGGRFRITLNLEQTGAGWKIIRQRAEKLN